LVNLASFVNADDLYDKKGLNSAQREVRQLAVNNLEAFIRLMAPYQLLGHCHIDLCSWITRHDDENKLLLWPRDHGKSRKAAFYAAWEIVRDPATTIIYGSATAEKAEEQLRFIKEILTSKIAFRYFPGLVEIEEGKRTAWNKTYIVVDHPHRVSEGVVDSTVMTCGLEKTITGKHCKRLILDDIVVPENNTEQGRKAVNAWAAQAASIMSADSSMLVVGTRYHPQDAYQMMIDMEAEVPIEDEDGELTHEPEAMFTVNIADVEQDGEFLWPRQQRKDGKYFGFNARILARKRAVYEAAGQITQFYAQYYNDPNDKSTAPISRDLFRYYKRSDLQYIHGVWHIDFTPIQLYCALDMATGTAEDKDYTVAIVGGVDTQGNRYIIEISRFRTDKISRILTEVKDLHTKYHFKKLRIEVVSGFKLVATDLADNLYRSGIRIPIDHYVPPNRESKSARINAILEPLYQSSAVYHYRGGNCQILEDELVSVNPEHDDTKDAWAMCCDLMEIPKSNRNRRTSRKVVKFHPKFGGLAA